MKNKDSKDMSEADKEIFTKGFDQMEEKKKEKESQETETDKSIALCEQDEPEEEGIMKTRTIDMQSLKNAAQSFGQTKRMKKVLKASADEYCDNNLELRILEACAWKPRKKIQRFLNAIKIMIRSSKEPMQARNIHYNLVSQFSIGQYGIDHYTNTKFTYGQLCQWLVMMRLRGEIPWNSIEDSTRDISEIVGFNSIDEYLDYYKDYFARNFWENQDKFILLIVEKQSLLPVIWKTAVKYRIPVLPVRGQSSWSIFNKEVKELYIKYVLDEGYYKKHGYKKDFIVLHIGDFDPSGEMSIPVRIQDKLRYFGMEPTIFEKIALNATQASSLPPAMAKKEDPNYAKFVQETGQQYSVEVEALSPDQLNRVLESKIWEHLDINSWTKVREEEYVQRRILEKYIPTLKWNLKSMTIDVQVAIQKDPNKDINEIIDEVLVKDKKKEKVFVEEFHGDTWAISAAKATYKREEEAKETKEDEWEKVESEGERQRKEREKKDEV